MNNRLSQLKEMINSSNIEDVILCLRIATRRELKKLCPRIWLIFRKSEIKLRNNWGNTWYYIYTCTGNHLIMHDTLHINIISSEHKVEAISNECSWRRGIDFQVLNFKT